MASLNLDRPLARAALETVTDEWSNVTNVHRRMRTWNRNSVSQVLGELYRGGKIERRSVTHRSWGAIWEYRRKQPEWPTHCRHGRAIAEGCDDCKAENLTTSQTP